MDFKDASFYARSYLIVTTLIYMKNILNNFRPIIQYLLHRFFNFNKYVIKTQENRRKIIKYIQNNEKIYALKYDENGHPFDLILNLTLFPKFIVYCDDEEYDFFIFCTNKTLEKFLDDNYNKKNIELDENHVPISEKKDDGETVLNKQEETDKLLEKNELVEPKKKKSIITIYNVNGMYGYHNYGTRNLNLNTITGAESENKLSFLPHQKSCFKDIMNFYKTNNYCKAMITGPPGTGKTFFSYLFAHKLSCNLCDTYNPTEPGTSFGILYNNIHNIGPTNPLIIVFDEIDIMIENIHNRNIQKHKQYRTEVYDKTSWSIFIDKFSFGLYPYVILIMISNKEKSELDKLDNAYLRKGRVDVFKTFTIENSTVI
jgi:SpoVK/Ycf46/Vps4 family AAA+-type ATPase